MYCVYKAQLLFLFDATVVLSKTLVLSKPANRKVIHERITVYFSFQTSVLLFK